MHIFAKHSLAPLVGAEMFNHPAMPHTFAARKGPSLRAPEASENDMTTSALIVRGSRGPSAIDGPIKRRLFPDMRRVGVPRQQAGNFVPANKSSVSQNSSA